MPIYTFQAVNYETRQGYLWKGFTRLYTINSIWFSALIYQNLIVNFSYWFREMYVMNFPLRSLFVIARLHALSTQGEIIRVSPIWKRITQMMFRVFKPLS